MTKKYKITEREKKYRGGLIVLSFFTYYLVTPIQEWVDANLSVNPVLIGVVGIMLTLYFFDF